MIGVGYNNVNSDSIDHSVNVDDGNNIALEPTHDSTDSNNTEYAECGSDALHLDPIQSENIFRRQTSGSFCKTGLTRGVNTPFKHFDPTKIRLQPKPKDPDPCAKFVGQDMHIGTCQGPEVSNVHFVEFRYAVNCILGQCSSFHNHNSVGILNNNQEPSLKFPKDLREV